MFHSRTYKIIVIFNILFISKAYEYIFPVERGKEEYSYQSWILGYTYKLTNYPKKSQEIYHCSLLNRDYLIVSFTQRHSHRYNFTNSKCSYIQYLSVLINQNVITILIHYTFFLRKPHHTHAIYYLLCISIDYSNESKKHSSRYPRTKKKTP